MNENKSKTDSKQLTDNFETEIEPLAFDCNKENFDKNEGSSNDKYSSNNVVMKIEKKSDENMYSSENNNEDIAKIEEKQILGETGVN